MGNGSGGVQPIYRACGGETATEDSMQGVAQQAAGEDVHVLCAYSEAPPYTVSSLLVFG